MSKAERLSYGYIEQTCPTVDELTRTCLELVNAEIDKELCYLSEPLRVGIQDKIEYRIETLVGMIKEKATEPMRQALIDVIDEMKSMEDERDEALHSVDKLSDERDNAISDADYWKDLYYAKCEED